MWATEQVPLREERERGVGAPKAGGEIAQQVRGLTALAEDPG